MPYRHASTARFALAIAVLTAAALFGPSSRAASPDYGGYRPHYQGDGVKTPGGRGGFIFRVTNLNDSGPGSLRAALEASGPRIVIFEISGYVTLSSHIFITNPFLTIAGQSAPSPGITVRRYAIVVDTHDVVIQHLRLRQGDEVFNPDPTTGNNASTLYIRNDAYNIVLDHVSLSWGTWTQLNVHAWNGGGWRDVTVLDSLISYGLVSDQFLSGAGYNDGRAAMYMPSIDGRTTFARNLMVHNSLRQPWISPGIRASVFNNVAFGSKQNGSEAMFLALMANGYSTSSPSENAWVTELVAQNNKWIGSYGTGSGTLSGTADSTRSVQVDLSAEQSAAGHRLFLEGNQGPHITGPQGDGQWTGVTFANSASRSAVDYRTAPSWYTGFGFSVLPTADVEQHVLANAGARPLDRDAVDRLAVEHTRTRTGSRVRSQNDMGGFPTLSVNTRALQVPANPNSVAQGQAFRTNVETWLEELARRLEPVWGAQLPTPPQNVRIAS